MDTKMLFEEVADGIRLLKSPFGGLWSGICLVNRGKKLLVDSGANADVIDECLVPALRKMRLKLEDLDLLLNTHCHGDHIGGHFRIRQLAPSLKMATFRGSLDKLREPMKYSKLIRARFPSESPPPPPVLLGVEPNVLLDDGDTVDTGAGKLHLIHTPGHDDDCVCFYDEATGTLISGDSIQGNGTPLQGIGFYQDLTAYRVSLRKLLDMKIETLVAGHPYCPYGHLASGDAKIRECLEGCLGLTYQYDRFIGEDLKAGAYGLDVIARNLIAKLDGACPEFMFLAFYTVSEHLKLISRK